MWLAPHPHPVSLFQRAPPKKELFRMNEVRVGTDPASHNPRLWQVSHWWWPSLMWSAIKPSIGLFALCSLSQMLLRVSDEVCHHWREMWRRGETVLARLVFWNGLMEITSAQLYLLTSEVSFISIAYCCPHDHQFEKWGGSYPVQSDGGSAGQSASYCTLNLYLWEADVRLHP